MQQFSIESVLECRERISVYGSEAEVSNRLTAVLASFYESGKYNYSVAGRKVCSTAFRLLTGLSKSKLSAARSQVANNTLITVHGNSGGTLSRKRLFVIDTLEVFFGMECDCYVNSHAALGFDQVRNGLVEVWMRLGLDLAKVYDSHCGPCGGAYSCRMAEITPWWFQLSEVRWICVCFSHQNRKTLVREVWESVFSNVRAPSSTEFGLCGKCVSLKKMRCAFSIWCASFVLEGHVRTLMKSAITLNFKTTSGGVQTCKGSLSAEKSLRQDSSGSPFL